MMRVKDGCRPANRRAFRDRYGAPLDIPRIETPKAGSVNGPSTEAPYGLPQEPARMLPAGEPPGGGREGCDDDPAGPSSAPGAPPGDDGQPGDGDNE